MWSTKSDKDPKIILSVTLMSAIEIAHDKVLQLQNPQDKSSNFTAKISFQLPPQRASGAMSINIWGHDQAHEPGVYDFMINLRLHYKESVQQISVDHAPRKVRGRKGTSVRRFIIVLNTRLTVCM